MTTSPYKGVKLNASIHKTLAELLQQSAKDPRLEMVSIVSVELNRDRSLAKVFWSTVGADGEREACAKALRRARGFLQSRLGDILRLRETPELRFYPDETLDRSLGVDEVLRELATRGEFEDETARRRRLVLADLVPPADLLAALRRAERLWLVPHWNPDPDAMGACLALAGALHALGKEARVFSYPDPPAGFAALPGHPRRTTPAAEAAGLLLSAPPDTLLMLDCHRRERAEPLADVLAHVANAWTIDHHLTSGRRQALPGWIEPVAESTCTLVYRVIEELARGDAAGDGGFTPDSGMLTNIYAGIVNDTGGFRFPSTLPLTFELAHTLARAGVDTAAVTEATLHRRSRAATALLQKVLASYTYHARGRVLTLRADLAMLAETGAAAADTEGMLMLASAVEGVAFVVFLKQIEADRWRASLRAPGGGDVQVAAARFGGGGHRAAAGCTLVGEPDALERELVDALLEQL